MAPIVVIISIIVGIFLLLLAVLWLIFPWFVHEKLSAIEKNTQKSAKTLEAILAALNADQAVQAKTEENTRAIANQNMRLGPTPPPI